MPRKSTLPPDAPVWVTEDRKVDEMTFCCSFLEAHPMKCVHGKLYTVDGLITDEAALKREIFMENEYELIRKSGIVTQAQSDGMQSVTCPHCGAPLKMTRGMEAGQVFMLGTKYSQALHATFLDESGKEQPLVMGCYGIGVGRTMAAAIEQNNDKDGIIWPRSIAPFEAVVVPVNAKVPEQLRLAEKIYGELKAAGVDVLLDDRKERAGVKFKDCDLIGYPLRITVGPKAVEEGRIELGVRKTGEVFVEASEAYLAKARELLENL